MKKALRLQRGHLIVGKPLPWNVYDGPGNLLLAHDYIIESEPQLEALLERGMYVDEHELEASIEKSVPLKRYDPFCAWDSLVAKLAYQLTHPSRETGFVKNVSDLGRLVQAQVQRSADATLAMMLLMADHRRYSTVHSLHVAFLAEMVANRIGWEKQRRSDVICAALTMNIGMHELQQQLSNQRTALTPEQRELIRQHPVIGASILRQVGVESPLWLSAVENHHETSSGKGYPRAIKDVDEESALLRTLDVFCAKVSPRMHRKPLSGTQAERVLFTEAGTASDCPFIPTLIKEIGVYPPGSFVRLVNGEIGVVHKRSSTINAPHVLTLVNSKGDVLIEPIRRDTSRETYRIMGDVQRDAVLININPAKIWTD